MILAEVGDVIFGLVFVFAGQLFLEWLTFLLRISFILTDFGSSVSPPFYLFLSPPAGDASEKPGCSQFADSAVGCSQKPLVADVSTERLIRTKPAIKLTANTSLRWEKSGPCSLIHSAECYAFLIEGLYECPLSCKEAKVCICYLYASLMRVIWLHFPKCYIHR